MAANAQPTPQGPLRRWQLLFRFWQGWSCIARPQPASWWAVGLSPPAWQFVGEPPVAILRFKARSPQRATRRPLSNRRYFARFVAARPLLAHSVRRREGKMARSLSRGSSSKSELFRLRFESDRIDFTKGSGKRMKRASLILTLMLVFGFGSLAMAQTSSGQSSNTSSATASSTTKKRHHRKRHHRRHAKKTASTNSNTSR